MNISTCFNKLKRATRILQMDKLLPRGAQGNLMTSSSSLLDRYSSSASTCFNLLHHSPLSPLLSRTKFHYFSFLKARNLSQSTMEKYPQDTEEAIKDQQREGYSEASSDYSNRASDGILPHILNLYASHATARDFEIYAPDATFEDPLMRAQGVKQIKSSFYSLRKIFSESRIVEYSIQEHDISPGKKEILIDNKQYYKWLGKDIHMTSLIKLQMQDGRVVRHEDRWDGKPLWNRETVKLPLVGRITEMSRRASMLATHALMGFGKDPID